MSFLKNQNLGSSIILPAIALILGSIALAFVVVFKAPIGGVVVIGIIVGLFVAMLVFKKYSWGLIFLLCFGVYMHHFARLAQTAFPFGVPYDLLIGVTFLSLFASQKRNNLDWSHFGNWVTYAYLIVMGYHLLQVGNPMGSVTAWAVSLRTFGLFLLYIVAYHYFSSLQNIKKITLLYIGIIISVALYGIFQEVVGFMDFEWAYIYETPERYKLYFIGGKMRKFSFLSDPSAYGLYLACGALSTAVLTLALPRWSYKVLFGTATLVILIAMSFSGTRTAYAMVAAGMFFYLLITIRSRKTIIIGILCGALGAIILFGPFNSWQVNRIRSAFYPSEDASMSVRDMKRVEHQPFIKSTPLGGGPYTTASNGSNYAGGHPFAGFDPDSGYLEIALEQGMIGLLLFLFLLSMVMLRGVENYFAIKDPLIKVALLVYLVPFFALTIAHYAQSALNTKPMDMILVLTLGLVSRIPQFRDEKADGLLKY